jgi:hypothetical protein
MDQQREEEFLLHIAAGIDPLTALAATPREDESPQQTASTADQWFSAVAWIVIACIGMAGFILTLLL